MTQLSPPQHRAYTYRVDSTTDIDAAALDLVKSALRVSTTTDDALITLYINAAMESFEDYTGRTLLTKTFTTFRDFFPQLIANEGYYQAGLYNQTSYPGNESFLLQQSPVQSVTSVVYDDTTAGETTVATSVYYLSEQADYSEVLTQIDQVWPYEVLVQQQQSIRIAFVAGYADLFTDLPAEIQVAIMNYVAFLYENRGDCSSCGSSGEGLPLATKDAFRAYRILKL